MNKETIISLIQENDLNHRYCVEWYREPSSAPEPGWRPRNPGWIVFPRSRGNLIWSINNFIENQSMNANFKIRIFNESINKVIHIVST